MTHIATKGELDEFEQLNIEKAIEWLIPKKLKVDDVLNEGFVLQLHKRMFGDVWKWAGTFRKSDKNFGVDKHMIGASLYQLNQDCLYWINHKTYEPDEIAIRYKHRIVQIHPFPNGNGRHSRLMADVIIEKLLNEKIFTWGNENISRENNVRKTYINSIIKADRGNIIPLLEFARTN
ncbi:MAG: mobile mystery protein B [Calditrichales bacterium]|nr:mobile mystery protein B [Calditrichales bacterium]